MENKYKVTVQTLNGYVMNYTYEGDGEYKGKFESVEDRIKRHFDNSKNTASYIVEKLH